MKPQECSGILATLKFGFNHLFVTKMFLNSIRFQFLVVRFCGGDIFGRTVIYKRSIAKSNDVFTIATAQTFVELKCIAQIGVAIFKNEGIKRMATPFVYTTVFDTPHG